MTAAWPAGVKGLLQDETGTIRKDWGGRLPIALIYPNTYHVGMSSLALHTFYRYWNGRDDVVCERVFSDWEPPHSLESSAPLDYFPVLAFSVSYEMDYFQVVRTLRAAGLPPLAADRDESHPLLVAGGPALSSNPEPLAPILDAVVVGEAEPILDRFTAALHHQVDGRAAALDQLAAIPGVYLPARHAPEEEPERGVLRQRLADLDAWPTYSALHTPHTEFSDMGLIEIARGCRRGCRFCLAGHLYRPPRQRSVASILDQAEELLVRGDRIGLVSAAVSDHTGIEELARELAARGARFSVSSMRIDPPSPALFRALAASGTRSVTLAPEAGSERLRQAIHKTQTEDDLVQAVELAAAAGLTHLKLYFMLGLPGEEQEDVAALVSLAMACARRFPGQVTVHLTPFVPKPHTPFQRLAQAPATLVQQRVAEVKGKLWPRGIAVRAESPAWAEIQGALARGDRRLGGALLAVDRLTPATWRRALKEVGLSAEHLLGERTASEPLPWAQMLP